MTLPLDGPSAQGTLSVTNATVVEAKVGVSVFDCRQVITLLSSQKVYVYFGNLETGAPSAGTVSCDGFTISKNQLVTFEASAQQPVYLLAVSSTASVRIAERG